MFFLYKKQQDPDGDSCSLESSPGVDDDAEPALHPAAALPESEDSLEEWIAGQPQFPDYIHLEPHPHCDAIPTSEQLHASIPGEESGKCEKWMFNSESMFEGSSPYTESGDMVNDSLAERSEDKALEADDVYYMENNVCYSDRTLSNGDVDRVDEAHPCPSLQNLLVEKLTLEQNGDDTSVSMNSSVIDKDLQPSHELGIAEVDSLLTDDLAPSEAEVSASESLNTSHSASPASSSSSPHHQFVSGSGSSTASSATGVPLQQGHPGMMGQTCFVRVHPMHVAAAVAAQHSRAAAVTHQRHLMAAAAAQQRAAVVAQQQRMAAAAAAHQRSQAAMMQQHLVRSRFVGAPVVVRPPAFVPVPGIATPVRVRMRLRRSVTMTEEYSVDRP